jgi:hypothetical protein
MARSPRAEARKGLHVNRIEVLERRRLRVLRLWGLAIFDNRHKDYERRLAKLYDRIRQRLIRFGYHVEA